MYTIQALWTAAHLKLPITYVIANNGGYRILKQRLKAFHGNDEPIGMDLVDPKVDFVGLAKAMGMAAERVSRARGAGAGAAARLRLAGAKIARCGRRWALLRRRGGEAKSLNRAV